ncbi:MAG: DNA polymerase III subunit alpha [Betaproteobacteria bacterium]|nr:DNA polymerase III subunit alpha [Betaproteobacteria bacterium]
MFVHLRLHTEFSIQDGTTRIDDALQMATQHGQPALAITDLGNLFGAIKFYKAAFSNGIQPIIGADIYLKDDTSQQSEISRLLLIAQNHQGYLNLCELLTRAWSQMGAHAQGVVQLTQLEKLSEGLIVLSGAQDGVVGKALIQGKQQRASEFALQLARIFPHRFYLEIQRAGRIDDELHVSATAQLASRLKLPLIATHPVQFTNPDDYESHEARVCISDGEILGNTRRVRKFTHDQFFKSTDQMLELFKDLPSAIQNTLEIAKRCHLTLDLGKAQLPDFPTPIVDGKPLPIETFFHESSHQGLQQRLLHLYPDQIELEKNQQHYKDRLDFEIKTIIKMGFPGYFLIVSDFINWAKKNGCPVGPGRGSGAGSLVAYALNITDLDPLQYNLLFERFLNPERVSMPDFDIDFCQTNRDRVIEYVKQKYGRDAVSQIATFGTMAARAAIRDVGRVLDLSYNFCDGIAKLIPNKPGQHMTIAKAIEIEPVLAQRLDKEEDVKALLHLAQKLEGIARNVGMHAGGVLIAPGKLTDFCPLYQQPGSDAAISQFDKDDVEAVGLVKFDFLGLATLTILEIAKDLIVSRHQGQENFSYENIPLKDAATYQLFAKGKTEAVFQFESRGMQGMLRDAKPSRLEDLIALNALYRPGPMDLIPSFVARKNGREKVEYAHPLVESVLSETYGIMVYQEQVMQTAQILGGYTLGGADLLRRAMGKKKPEEMAEHRNIFREGAAKQNISPNKADEIFDLMEKFAGYGFNKSHAAAYSLLAYHTGWLKVHYTAEFFCANMTVEMDDTDKLKVLHEDAVKLGLSFEAPDINRGNYRFEPVSNRVIRYGLGAIKGSGQQAIEAVVKARQAGGAFTSLFDFAVRVDRSKFNKRTLESLIKAGAFDTINLNRASLLASVDRAFDFSQSQQVNALQSGLFDSADTHGSSTQEPDLIQVVPWHVKERLTQEKTAVGFYLSGHLFDEVDSEVRQFAKLRLEDLIELSEPVVVAGIVSDLRQINIQRGKLTFFKLDDKSTSIDVTVDEAVFNANKHLIKDDQLVILMVKAQPDRFSGGLRIQVQQAWDLAGARCRFGKYMQINVNGKLPDLDRILKDHPARVESTENGNLIRGLSVRFQLIRDGAQAQIDLGEAAKFFPTDAALAAWTSQAHQGQAQIIYD